MLSFEDVGSMKYVLAKMRGRTEFEIAKIVVAKEIFPAFSDLGADENSAIPDTFDIPGDGGCSPEYSRAPS